METELNTTSLDRPRHRKKERGGADIPGFSYACTDFGRSLELTLFRRIILVSGGHTEESAKLKAHNDCLKFCYYYNRLNPFQAIGIVFDA